MVLVSQAPPVSLKSDDQVDPKNSESEDGLVRLIREKLVETQTTVTDLDHRANPELVCKLTVAWLKQLVFDAKGKAYVTYVNWLCWYAVRGVQRGIRSSARLSASTIKNHVQLELPGWERLTKWKEILPDGNEVAIAYMTRAQVLWVASQYASAARDNSIKEAYLTRVADEMRDRRLADDATVETLYRSLGKAPTPAVGAA